METFPASVFQVTLVRFFVHSFCAKALRIIIPLPPLSRRAQILTGRGLPKLVFTLTKVNGINFFVREVLLDLVWSLPKLNSKKESFKQASKLE